jgi:hypothetical protein
LTRDTTFTWCGLQVGEIDDGPVRREPRHQACGVVEGKRCGVGVDLRSSVEDQLQLVAGLQPERSPGPALRGGSRRIPLNVLGDGRWRPGSPS